MRRGVGLAEGRIMLATFAASMSTLFYVDVLYVSHMLCVIY